MSIKPADSGHLPRPDLGRLEKSPHGAPARPAGEAPAPGKAPPADRVEVSSAARELRERIAAERPPSGELEPGRLAELARRIASGYYDQPQVQDQVARRVSGDLRDPAA